VNKYQSYHTSIKSTISLGIEKSILPASFLDSIPRTTLQTWKDIAPEKYVGYEFASQIESNMDDVHTMLDERIKLFRRSFFAFARIYILILNSIGKKEFLALVRKNKYVFVDLIENLSSAFENKAIASSICKFLRITPKMFVSWKYYRLYACDTSLIKVCFKRLPQQISQGEIAVLKSYLRKGRFSHWSVSSIWAKAIREGVVSMSRSTWYRYARKLGLTKPRLAAKRLYAKESVRATMVNQIWHMDVSYYTTSDNVKMYVYSVMDNLSRKLVDCSYSCVLSAELRTESLKRAIYKEFDVDLDHPKLDLIVDGGSENNNTTVQEFIKNCHVNINKKIALKEVRYSNNMIEASFKVMKQGYFKYKDIHSKDFGEELEYFKHDYNYVRPHYAHTLFTPHEVSQNPSLLNIKPKLAKINHARLEANRVFCCKELEK